MANKAISELPQAQNVNNQDLFVLEQSGIAKKLPAETFITEQGIIDALAEALDGHGGIQSVTLSSVSGRIRTYRITFTDQSTTTFQVYDGTSIDRISRTSSSGLDDVYTIFLSDGTTTFFTVHNGADGTVSEAMLNNALKDKAPAVTETTESSAIANFTDGADDMPLHNILAEINPVQDLTYGDPYPAGGGVNILPPPTSATASASGTITNDNGLLTISTTGEIVTFFIRIPEFTFAESGQKIELLNSFTNGTVYFFNGNTQVDYFSLSSVNRVVSESSMSAMKGKTINSYRITVNAQTLTNATFAMMVTDSSTSALTAFSPYSNICPITGHTEVNVTRTGKNLFDKNAATDRKFINASGQEIASNNYGHSSPIKVKPNTKYCMTGYAGAGYFAMLGLDGNMNTLPTWYGGASKTAPFVATTPSNCAYIILNYLFAQKDSIAFYESDTVGEFIPYQGETYSITFSSSAGTVYGGTIDVATGLLTVDRAIVDLGTKNWGYLSPTSNIPYGLFYAVISGKAKKEKDVICSSYPLSTNDFKQDKSVLGNNAANTVYVIDSSYTDTTTFASAMSGVQLCYELETPQTYQLTPQEVIKTLLGTNNVWADTGNVSVTYPADTKMFIEKLTMPTEDDLVANQAITSGKFFMVGNNLYLATAAIASGAKIIEGTNATRLSLADALNRLK